jgi:hypothetical protein
MLFLIQVALALMNQEIGQTLGFVALAEELLQKRTAMRCKMMLIGIIN